MHVDDWLDSPFSEDQGEIYAKFVLEYKRMPAWKQNAFERYMNKYILFCTYNGKRYRCTGASRMGDVWLHSDFSKDSGYTLRVDVDQCSNWGANIEVEI